MSSVFPDDYEKLLIALVDARKRAGITQAELATKLGRPQSFVSKFENGERRLDVAEFLRIAALVNADPASLISNAQRS